MKIIADTHCHTIASTHAYSTVMENITAAKSQGLYALAITDHAEHMPGSPGTWYFNNLKAIPKVVEGVNVLKGIEGNVLNVKGELDIPQNLFEPLDWVIASIHDAAYTGNHGTEECTETWLNICKNPLVNVIGHSGRYPSFIYDFEKVIPEFGRNGKLVEINESSFSTKHGQDCKKNCKDIALMCKKHRVNVILNSDAHFCTNVGKFSNAISLLKEIDFPEELIINADINRFKNYLEEYTSYFKS